MTRRQRVPLSESAWRVLRALKGAGGTAPAESLLEPLNGSWHRLLGAVGALESRGLVRLRPGYVVLTRDGLRALSSRFAH